MLEQEPLPVSLIFHPTPLQLSIQVEELVKDRDKCLEDIANCKLAIKLGQKTDGVMLVTDRLNSNFKQLQIILNLLELKEQNV